MIIKASAKGVRLSPRKVGVVAALVRGRSVSEAITILEHTPRRASLTVKKLIESVRANAENNHNLVVDSLELKSISVTPGPRLKRYRPVARGGANKYQKKSSHIFVEVNGEAKAPKKPVAAAKTEEKKESK